MSRSQFISDRILLFVLLLLVVPSYGLYANHPEIAMHSLIIGGLLWVWKWRWWWNPIREFVERRDQ